MILGGIFMVVLILIEISKIKIEKVQISFKGECVGLPRWC